ncbi:MAG TPA: ATP-binding cassette domain-containing protein [Thermoanaerobaculia bacterium]
MSILLEQLTKRYQGHPVVNNVSLEIADGEFFVLLGPSGSGKSTVLRMIAGLTGVDAGRVLLHGREVTDLPPKRRGVGFVFQHYALFRGMTVADNIEFALRIRRVPRAERRRRRDELLELVGLAGLGGRMPTQLSGGQQQRVALARALAHQPEVLLLDEPFGALDARIRTELRRTIREIQREIRLTTVFVTHDQDEAFELADRLAVLNFGRLLEYGPPQELYLRPQTEFVATFLGTANLLVGEVTGKGVKVGPLEFPLATQGEPPSDPRRVQVLFRPEDVALRGSLAEMVNPLLGQGVVEATSFLGSVERLRLRLPALPGARPIAPAAPFGGDFLLVEASRSQYQSRRQPLKPGDDVWVGVRRVHALVHPGLSLLLPIDGSPESRAALALAGQLARLAHARVTVLGCGAERAALDGLLQEAKEQLGSGLAAVDARAAEGELADAVVDELRRDEHDLVVLGYSRRDGVELAERALQAGGQHLLMVPAEGAAERPIPSRVLICVAVGEPGKEDVLFAGRLVRHLGAEATVLKVIAEGPRADGRAGGAVGADGAGAAGGPGRARGRAGAEPPEQIERFLAASARSLGRLGVPASTRVRRGVVVQEIRGEMAQGEHNLLVLGAPLADRRGRVALEGVVQSLLEQASQPILIVRARQEAN